VLQAQYNYQGQTLQTMIGEIYDEKVDTAARMRESGVEIPAGIDTVTRYSIKQGNKDITGSRFSLGIGVSKFTQSAIS
jgi:phosphate transport system permease protein